jgi:hypothetical protein
MLPVLNKVLSIDGSEVTFARRGFLRSRHEVQDRLEHVGTIFLLGYHAALRENELEVLASRLEQVASEYRGFAYEGAAMGLALRDGMLPGSTRLTEFIAGPGRRHIYMLHVGAGWACARLPWLRWRIEKFICKFDPVLRWLVLDGYGFHQGYFHFNTPQSAAVKHLSADARHVFYQGFGRSLWFVHGCDFHQIATTIFGFPEIYQSDAWSGIGLACAYAGGARVAELADAVSLAGSFTPVLALGVAFAAKVRQLAGNDTPHTEEACAVLAGINAERAALVCDRTLNQVNKNSCSPYQQWRELIQNHFSSSRNPVRGNSHDSELVQSLVPVKPD